MKEISTKNEKSKLKKLAQSAKERLKSGYWTEVKREREKARQVAAMQGKSAEAINNYYQDKFSRETKSTITKINQNDEALYKKVCAILEKDEDIINPVNYLIDQEKYQNMDFASRQRYLLMLMSKYSELKERYIKEKIYSAYVD